MLAKHLCPRLDMKPVIEAFESEDGSWGIEEVYSRTQRYTLKGIPIASTCTIYDALFSEQAAKRIAQLLRCKKPPKDWEATKEILLSEGFINATIDAPETSESS